MAGPKPIQSRTITASHPSNAQARSRERVKAWEACMLPLNDVRSWYTKEVRISAQKHGHKNLFANILKSLPLWKKCKGKRSHIPRAARMFGTCQKSSLAGWLQKFGAAPTPHRHQCVPFSSKCGPAPPPPWLRSSGPVLGMLALQSSQGLEYSLPCSCNAFFTPLETRLAHRKSTAARQVSLARS